MAAMLIIATWPSGSGAGTEAGDARRPNVILISIDTLRADHVSAYGYARQTTPSIDRLASNGILFANASSQSSWTLPSHISLMTSSYPHAHGVHDDDRRLGPGSPTLAESLDQAGYETAGFVSWLYVGPLFGFDRGFDRYTALIDRGAIEFASGGGARPAAAVTGAAIGFLREPRERPFFLFVHYFDPHMDYRPPKPYDELYDPGYAGTADGSWSCTQPYNDAVTTDARETVDVRLLRLPEGRDLPGPERATADAAGFDLRARVDGSLDLPVGGRVKVPTGIALQLPAGYEGQVRPRSGLAVRHGLTILNSPGTVDADYRGEIQVVLINLGQEPVTIRRGDRIAQLVVQELPRVHITEAGSLEATDRGAGGFGHTGDR